ncbi:MAG TPA: hypothetical protein VK551_02720 [Thermodesulfobacteriota bacterium]|nr:hypothetical protein [Thermodesulfobacteriota bacterium]
MRKIFLMVLIVGMVFGCATTKDSTKEMDFTKWTDQELMDRYNKLDPASQLALGVLSAASSSVLGKEERKAIRKELEARGYEYHPEKKQAAFSSDHPEWVK